MFDARQLREMSVQQLIEQAEVQIAACIESSNRSREIRTTDEPGDMWDVVMELQSVRQSMERGLAGLGLIALARLKSELV